MENLILRIVSTNGESMTNATGGVVVQKGKNGGAVNVYRFFTLKTKGGKMKKVVETFAKIIEQNYYPFASRKVHKELRTLLSEILAQQRKQFEEISDWNLAKMLFSNGKKYISC